MTESAVSMPAHAKLNLFLRVLARETDGYHSIETLFCLVTLADALRAERREGRGVTVEVRGADPGPATENLAVRAATMVLDATGNRFAVHLILEKRIPMGAGLGGGSSDAAAALQLVNHLAANAVPRHELLQFAAKLGSDVPFFLSGAPLALGWSRGERLLRLPPLPSAPALLLSPVTPIKTADAYGWLDATRQPEHRRGALALDLDVLTRWGRRWPDGGQRFRVAGLRPDTSDPCGLRSAGWDRSTGLPHERVWFYALCRVPLRARSGRRDHAARAKARSGHPGRHAHRASPRPYAPYLTFTILPIEGTPFPSRMKSI